CHLGNISYRLGEEISVADAERKLSDIRSTDNVKDTWERTIAHLKDNKVDLNAIQIRFGANLAFDPEKETFPGSGMDKANAMLTREYRAPFVVPGPGNV